MQQHLFPDDNDQALNKIDAQIHFSKVDQIGPANDKLVRENEILVDDGDSQPFDEVSYAPSSYELADGREVFLDGGTAGREGAGCS